MHDVKRKRTGAGTHPTPVFPVSPFLAAHWGLALLGRAPSFFIVCLRHLSLHEINHLAVIGVIVSEGMCTS